jgi:hypothetical protein
MKTAGSEGQTHGWTEELADGLGFVAQSVSIGRTGAGLREANMIPLEKEP